MTETPRRSGEPIIARWNSFWYGEGNPLGLGVFRALFGVCLLWEIPITRAKSAFAIEGGFHLPYSAWIPPIPQGLYEAIHDWQYLFAILLLIGAVPRVASAALLLLQGYIFFADQLNFRNHPYFFLIILLLLTFSPAGASFSINSLVRRLRERATGKPEPAVRIAPLTAQRLIQVQVSIVYFYAGLHKLTEHYVNGIVLAEEAGPGLLTGAVGRFLDSVLPTDLYGRLSAAAYEPAFWVVPAWLTVATELGLAFALWSPRWRKWGMFIGGPFHLAIALLMNIWVFSIAMIASYLLFLDPGTLPRLVQRVHERRGTVGPGKKKE